MSSGGSVKKELEGEGERGRERKRGSFSKVTNYGLSRTVERRKIIRRNINDVHKLTDIPVTLRKTTYI